MWFFLAVVATTWQAGDTATYNSPETARLIAHARATHAVQDSLVDDYQALVRTRVDAGLGRSRFSLIPPLAAVETAARITWSRPNNLGIDVVGFRAVSAYKGLKLDGTFSDPWFIPRGLGDSIRFVDDEIPENAALHPLAPGAERYYRYRVFDSVSIRLPEREVHTVGVRVEPKGIAPALIAGNLWLDTETTEVVRMTFVFVGDYLWDLPDSNTAADSARARKANHLANRIVKVEADLEYALHQTRFWMPYRQLVTLTVEIPWFINATVPVHFITTFSQYQINTNATPRFTLELDDSTESRTRCHGALADSLCGNGENGSRKRNEIGYRRAERWSNGRWEIDLPPLDSLERYQWPDQLSLSPDPAAEQLIRETSATIARLSQDLPAEWVGRRRFGLAYERFSDLFRFNRVQGASFGVGYELRPGPLFTTLQGTARFGLADRRPTASLTLRRDAPGGRLDIAARRAVQEAEPWTAGQSFGNSLNAVFTGHDDADYHLVFGGGISFLGYAGLFRNTELSVGWERVRNMSTATGSRVNDWLGGSGILTSNPTVSEGDFLRARLTRRFALWPGGEAGPGLEALSGPAGTTVRGWGTGKLPLRCSAEPEPSA